MACFEDGSPFQTSVAAQGTKTNRIKFEAKSAAPISSGDKEDIRNHFDLLFRSTSPATAARWGLPVFLGESDPTVVGRRA